MHWQTLHWIAGGILALAWFSRIVEAAFGMPRIADIARPNGIVSQRLQTASLRVSIIVPARNEEEHIRETLVQLLGPRLLELRNYCGQRPVDRSHRPDHG